MQSTGAEGKRNVAVVKGAFDRFHAGDLDGVFELVHPEVQFLPAFYPGTYSGRDMVRRILESVGARRLWNVERLEFSETEGRVLVRGRLHETNTLGATGDFPITWVVDVEDGLIVRMQGFVHERQALAAIG